MTEPVGTPGDQPAASRMADMQEANEHLLIAGLREQDLSAALEVERARLALILASIGDAVVVVDRAEAAVRTNAAYEALFAEGALLQGAHGEPLPPDETPLARAGRGEAFSMQASLTTARGEHRWVEANGQPLHDVGVEQVVVVIRDITASSLHRQLQDEFLARAGHELRTPLSAAQGFMDLVLRTLQRGDGDERAQRYTSSALHALHRLAALVRDLVDAARLESGKVGFAFEATDLAALAARTVEMARVLPSAPDIRLDAGAEPLVVRGDAGRLEQVLLNLITNAITYASGPIEVRLRRQGGEAALEVRDDGPGIAAAALSHLFDRFYQIERDDRSSQAGLGLGLYICREIVAAHGGRIEAASTEGSGTTFTVWLPLLDVA